MELCDPAFTATEYKCVVESTVVYGNGGKITKSDFLTTCQKNKDGYRVSLVLKVYNYFLSAHGIDPK